MPKRFYILISLIVIVFVIFGFKVYDISVNKHDYYEQRYLAISEVYVSGSSAPRGRILDTNGKVIVDNIGINCIVYHKNVNTSFLTELETAKKLVELTNYKYKYNESKLKEYYMLINPDAVNDLITEEEYALYKKRKITSKELKELKLARITDEMLGSLSDLEKYSSYFYYLMNDGYYYANKTLLSDLTDAEYASILEANLPGIFGEIQWKRNYVYGDTLKSILGSISNSLPYEKRDLLKNGYTYTDKVGISGLEEYYEEYLKGEKAVYKVNSDNSLVEIKEAKRGNDLVLNIDIDMQVKVEEIIKEQILKAKGMPNTEFYTESYAIISEPSTGNVKVIAGIRINTNGVNYSFQDVSINTIKNAYTMGSVVKAASMTVGYLNNVIDIGTTMTDSCVKLYSIPAKCSYTRLGVVNDLTALTHSSNYYQFITALGIAGYKYSYNMKVEVGVEDFNKYRDTFALFGLGSTTGIDLSGETSGLKGTKIAPDLLLNLAIGQYDLYTPLELAQYANTVASSGTRLKLNLMKEIKNEEQVILKNDVQVLNTIDLEEKYMKRIQSGLKDAIKHGTGYYYVDQSYDAAGKTGTSESYIDSDYNGTLDSYVVSNTFWLYAPFDNPKYSVVVISPNTSNLKGNSSYRTPVNRLIARNINDFLFTS